MKFLMHKFTLAITAAAALAPATGISQTARPSGGASTQSLMQLQQLANEKARLEAEVSSLKGELEKAAKERDSLKKSQQSVIRRSQGSEAELARAVADRARLEGELAQEKSRVQELVNRMRDTAVSLRDVESQGEVSRRTLTEREQDLAARDQELNFAQERNAKLHALAMEMIEKFNDQGFWSSLARREPFTQLKRVELENLADGYRGAADDLRLPAPSGARR